MGCLRRLDLFCCKVVRKSVMLQLEVVYDKKVFFPILGLPSNRMVTSGGPSMTMKVKQGKAYGAQGDKCGRYR